MPEIRTKADVMRMLDAQARAVAQAGKDHQAWIDAHILPDVADTPPTLPNVSNRGLPFSNTKR